MAHLGARVSALLDGQLSPEEADRAWAHVHGCHACRDLVEREGWIKTRLSGLSQTSATGAPADLKGMLKGRLADLGADDGDASTFEPAFDGSAGDFYLALAAGERSRRTSLALAAIGGGAVGAAVMGVLTLGAAPADAPTVQQPTVSIRTPVNGVGEPVTTIRRLTP